MAVDQAVVDHGNSSARKRPPHHEIEGVFPENRERLYLNIFRRLKRSERAEALVDRLNRLLLQQTWTRLACPDLEDAADEIR